MSICEAGTGGAWPDPSGVLLGGITLTMPMVRAQWWMLPHPGDIGTRLRMPFSEEEMARINRLRCEQDRRTHRLAHAVAKSVLADCSGRSGTENLTIDHDEQGRPRCSQPLIVSLSHSRNTVGAVVGDRPVGIDVEDLERVPEAVTVRDALCHREERRMWEAGGITDVDLLKLWVAKEALVKTGTVTLDRLAEIDLREVITGGAQETPGPGHRADRGCGWWTGQKYGHRLVVWQDRRCVGSCAWRVPQG